MFAWGEAGSLGEEGGGVRGNRHLGLNALRGALALELDLSLGGGDASFQGGEIQEGGAEGEFLETGLLGLNCEFCKFL